MRIFILHNRIKKGSYAEALFHLLIEYLKQQGFTLSEYDDIKEAKDVNYNLKKMAVILHTGKKELSFFLKISVGSFIKKNGFSYLVQVTDSKPISSGLSQLIISNDVQTFVKDSHSTSISFAVCSEIERQNISEQLLIDKDRLKYIPLTAEDEFQPITWSVQQSIKINYTQGREYFVLLAEGKTLASFTDLLKAFSTFKKWQLSSMKLVVWGKLSFTEGEEWKEKISRYKFREDVVLLSQTSNTTKAQMLAASYAFIHTPQAGNDILPLLQAMKCETPTISFSAESIEEYAKESAIIIEQKSYDVLAEKMILIYKDEALRNRLIAKGKEVSAFYTKEKTFVAFAEAFSLPFH